MTLERRVSPEAKRGWDSDFHQFQSTGQSIILRSLQRSYPDTSIQERNSWRDSVPRLQREIREVVEVDVKAARFTAVLEYQLPMESRRADVVLLLRESVVVIELKGKAWPTDADIDQAHAYARDLRCYHRECHDRPVHAVLVPTRMRGRHGPERNVHICGPSALDGFVATLGAKAERSALDAKRFLAEDAYRPLPTLVRAARDLFLKKKPPQLWRAAANTDRAVKYARQVALDANRRGTRHLVIVTGVPGSGKTLVGMRLVHAPELEGLQRDAGGNPSVFLSGNGPLVEVLQHVLKQAGGGGKAFVRHIRDYVKRYSMHQSLVPVEHVIVFDEAQRAFDRNKVADTHRIPPKQACSEPEHFIEFAERVPDWSVTVGLVGGGQEIHIGEEGGLPLWSAALKDCADPGRWTVHCPRAAADTFADAGVRVQVSAELSLDTTLRSHRATRLHEFVGLLLQRTPAPASQLSALAAELLEQGHDLRITRERELAESYLKDRYRDCAEARYGLVASSRDKYLPEIGVRNDYFSRRRIKCGPWYNDLETDEGERSCRHLRDCITEFEAQGLELDAALLAWGTDFALDGGEWSIQRSMKYLKKHSQVRDPWQLRANAYRVLLTRGRDAHVVFIPELPYLDETCEFLTSCGFRPLK